MIEIRNLKNNDLEFIEKYNIDNINNVKIIWEDEIRKGVIEYKDMGKYIYLDLIEIDSEYRRKGIGKSVVNELVKHRSIFGDCLPNRISFEFWKSMGAEFDEDAEIGIIYNNCIPFVVNKRK